MSNVDFSSIRRLLGLDSSSTASTTSTSSTANTNNKMKFSDEYKTNLEQLEQMYSNGNITYAQYYQLKAELDADNQIKTNYFDTNKDGFLTGYEQDLYDDFAEANKDGETISGNGTTSKTWYKKYGNTDLNNDRYSTAEERAIGEFNKQITLAKNIDSDSDGELNVNEQAAIDAYQNAIANPDSSFNNVALTSLVENCSSPSEKVTMLNELKKFDVDNDGSLNYAEYQAMQAYFNPPETTKVGSTEDETDTTVVEIEEVDETDAELLAKFDIDGDGKLNASEQAALDAYKAQKEEAALIAKFDIDGDGILSTSEQAALEAYKAQKEESELIAKFDIDGDGILDAAEQAALNAYKEAKEDEELKAKFDLDGNGVLDAAEQAAMNAYKEAKKQEELKAKFDIDGNGVLDAAEQAALKAYSGVDVSGGIIDTNIRINGKAAIEVEDTTEDETSVTPAKTEESDGVLSSLYKMIQSMMLAMMNQTEEEEVEEEEESTSTSPAASVTLSSSSSSSGSSEKTSLYDKMMEFKIAQEMHRLIDTEEPEADEEIAAEEAKEGLDVVEEAFDFDGNQSLDDNESSTLNTYVHKQAMKRVNEKFDINGDGELDDDETEMRDDYMAKVKTKREAAAGAADGTSETGESGETSETSDTTTETPSASDSETPAASDTTSSGDTTVTGSSDAGSSTSAASSSSSSSSSDATVKKTE